MNPLTNFCFVNPMVQDYRQNQIESAVGSDPMGQTIRLLQVLNGRATEVQAATANMHDMATLLSFADYTDTFRRVQEFLSFCDVIESRLEELPASARETILHEVNAVKTRAFIALLRGMGAYLITQEKRGTINFFAQAVFLMQQDVLDDFRKYVLPNLPPQLIPENLNGLYDEVQQVLKRLLDRCVEVPDFRFG